jgi:hypothetical protein
LGQQTTIYYNRLARTNHVADYSTVELVHVVCSDSNRCLLERKQDCWEWAVKLRALRFDIADDVNKLDLIETVDVMALPPMRVHISK